jgi:hypothetical protein
MQEIVSQLEWPRIIYHESDGIKSDGHDYTYKRCESLEEFAKLIDQGWELYPPEQRAKLEDFEEDVEIDDQMLVSRETPTVDVVVEETCEAIAPPEEPDETEEEEPEKVEIPEVKAKTTKKKASKKKVAKNKKK